MSKYRMITPEGTKDFLFEECAARRQVEGRLARLFEGYGFTEVVTPGVEFLDVFDAMPQEQMYKLTDSKGRLITLRPDSTMPIARLAATRLKNHSLPIRLYYNQSVYNANPALSGHSNEVVQTGIEVIGADACSADLEVLAMALEVLQCSDAADFRLELSHIGIFHTLMKKLSLSDEISEELRGLIESKNYPALSDRLAGLGNDPMLLSLRQMPRLFGGAEVLDRASRLFADPDIDRLIEELRRQYQALSALTEPRHITVDLGLVNRPSYYTGIVFRGYLAGHGEAVLSGGRYDRLLSRFGADLPAIGFGVQPDALAAALLQKGDVSLPHPSVLVCAEQGCEAQALRHRRNLADQNLCTEYAVYTAKEEAEAYAAERGIPRLDFVTPDGIATETLEEGERL